MFNSLESQWLCLPKLLYNNFRRQLFYKQQKSISHNTNAWEVQDHGVDRFNVPWLGPLSWFTDNGFACVLTWEKEVASVYRHRICFQWLWSSFHAPSQSLCYCVLDFNPGIRGRPKCSDHSSYSKEQTPTHSFLNSSLNMGKIGKEQQGVLIKKMVILCFVFWNKSEVAIPWHLKSSQIWSPSSNRGPSRQSRNQNMSAFRYQPSPPQNLESLSQQAF